MLCCFILIAEDDSHNRHLLTSILAYHGFSTISAINGRNAISWEDKFELDLWYVENQSFWLDVKILFLTVKKVLVREGVSGAGEVTMSKFRGTLQSVENRND